MKKNWFVVVVLIVSLFFSTTSVQAKQSTSPAQATATAGIYQSCPRGAYAGISASGNVTARFYLASGGYYTVSYNYGAGMSKTLTTSASASYSYVSVTTNGSILGTVSAGCR